MDLRELDKIVAVEIMGWIKNTTLDYSPIYYPPGPPEMNMLGHAIPLYSSDDKAAHGVLTTMQNQGFGREMLDALPGLGATPVEPRANTPITSSSVSPLDICIEALKIKNIDVSEWVIPPHVIAYSPEDES